MSSPIKPDTLSRADLYIAAARALARQDVPPLLMRDDLQLLDTLIEVDILVPSKKLDRAVAIVSGEGWELLDSGLFHPCKRAMVKFHNGDLLKLDLHGQVIDNGLVYLADGAMFEGASDSGVGFLLPSDEAWMAHTILHTILGKTVVPPKLREGMSQRLERGLDTARMRSFAKPYGLTTQLETALTQIVRPRDFDNSQLIAALRRSARSKLFLSARNSVRHVRRSAVWAVGQAMGWRPGVLIAFIGPDGAGKSSTIEAFSKHLSRMEIPVRSAYLGPWDRHYLKTSKWLVKFGAGPCDYVLDLDERLPPLIRAKKKISAHIKRALYYSNLTLEIWARHFRYVLPQLGLRRILLSDRYAYDLEIGHFNSQIKTWRPIPCLVARLAPTPHVLVLLDNDAETIWARKKEYPLETIRDVLGRYHVTGKRHGAIVVRTDRPPDVVAYNFLETHWRKIIRLRRDRIRFWH